MSKLLIEENPLMLLPGLAREIGLHEAIIIQQLHYWIEHRGPDGRRYGALRDKMRWIRNTVSDWQKSNFCFLSESQIYRALKSLEDQELILSRKDLNKLGYDRTKWYTIDYAILRQREMDFTPARNGFYASEDTIPETTPETKIDINDDHDFFANLAEKEIIEPTETDDDKKYRTISNAFYTLSQIPPPNPGARGYADWRDGVDRLMKIDATVSEMENAKAILDEAGYTYNSPGSFVRTIANMRKTNNGKKEPGHLRMLG
jgi:hypothetical protein